MSKEAQAGGGSRVLGAARKVPLLAMIFRRLDARQQEVVSLLRSTAVFGGLSERELVEILQLLHERQYAPGEVVFSEGDPGLGLYVVLRGEVEIQQKLKDGTRKLALLGPGDVFGEVSFLDGGIRSATVTSCGKVDLIGFYRTELFDLLERKPMLASRILLALARQISLRMRATLQMVQP